MQVRKLCPRLGAWSRSKFGKSRGMQRIQQLAWCYRKELLPCVSDDFKLHTNLPVCTNVKISL